LGQYKSFEQEIWEDNIKIGNMTKIKDGTIGGRRVF
jgi:hypothetical protein